jgi:hypothetical protein
MCKLVDATAENTDTIRLRNSTIDFLKQLSDDKATPTYDEIITKLIRTYRKQIKQEQWSRDHPFSPNPNPDLD